MIAELSANHGQSLQRARELVCAAAASGADAIKLQTYTPDTITIDCDNPHFKIQGTACDGQSLYKLYQTTFTPWEWHQELRDLTHSLGLEFFSTPFDETAVEFLEALEVPVYKIASFELVDIALLKQVALTGKPVIASTGMASENEIRMAVETLRTNGCEELALLKCTSAYPAPPNSLKLSLVQRLINDFECLSGISDHTLGNEAAIAAVALGGSIVEKHITLSRAEGGPDAGFSLEPDEFAKMVDSVRKTEQMLAGTEYGAAANEEPCRRLRRSIFVVQDIRAGEMFNQSNLRSIRPGSGLPSVHLDEVQGRVAKVNLSRGTPLSWDHIQ